MKIGKVAVVVALGVASALFSQSPARADLADQATKLSFSQPVAVPGAVLPAGTYLFKVDSDDRNVVRIYSADETKLYATIQTIAAQRLEPNDKTVVTVADRPNGMSNALVTWFYPGELFGHEFVYSKHEEQQLAQLHQQTIEVKDTAVSGD